MSDPMAREEAWESRVLLRLEGWGARVDEAMERFLEDEPLYLKSLQRFAREGILDRLEERLAAGQIQEAFEVVHSMKGTASILSLEPLLGKIPPVSEPLREGSLPAREDFLALKETYRHYQKLLER